MPTRPLPFHAYKYTNCLRRSEGEPAPRRFRAGAVRNADDLLVRLTHLRKVHLLKPSGPWTVEQGWWDKIYFNSSCLPPMPWLYRAHSRMLNLGNSKYCTPNSCACLAPSKTANALLFSPDRAVMPPQSETPTACEWDLRILAMYQGTKYCPKSLAAAAPAPAC